MICPNCNIETKKKNIIDHKGNSTITENCPACNFVSGEGTVRIDEVFVYALIDENDKEGVPAIQIEGMAMPLIAADRERLNYLNPIVEDLARRTKSKIRLLRFSNREVLRVIE